MSNIIAWLRSLCATNTRSSERAFFSERNAEENFATPYRPSFGPTATDTEEPGCEPLLLDAQPTALPRLHQNGLKKNTKLGRSASGSQSSGNPLSNGDDIQSMTI